MDLQTQLATGVLDQIFKRALAPATAQQAQRAPQVAYEAAKELAPVLVNQTNNEPWYQSRVTWGAIGAIATGVLGIAGVTLTPEDTALVVTIGTSAGAVVGGVLTLYGRWKAKKPIGA